MNAQSGFGPATFRLLALALFACVGCASFSNPTLPLRSLDDLEREGKLSAITYEFSEGNSLGNIAALSQASAPAPVVASVLQARVEPIFRRVFAEATRQQQAGEWHVDMYYRETARNPALTMTLAFFFIGSLGIVPAYGRDDLYLEAKLKHNGATVRQYVYSESVATWMHWFVLPWAYARDPLERKSALIDNMLLNLLHDLRGELPVATSAH
jgi:hypothetical protein